MKALMSRAALLLIALLLAAFPLAAQKKEPPTEAALAEISARGRMLAEYDTAAWYSTDAVQALSPKEGSITRYVAKKTPAGWVVAYGHFNEKHDKFLIVYEAVQGATPQDFKATKHEPPTEDTGFYFLGALALETAIAAFKGEQRPYNAAVLPASNGQMWVYIVPAPTETGVWPLGGDVRYLISKDGQKIVEKRQLHKAILEYRTDKNQEQVAGVHIAILDDIPEDTDVFFVLTRKPSVPEWVGTENFVYGIAVDGKIIVMRKEDFLKIGKEK
jgi:hypothetical protein